MFERREEFLAAFGQWKKENLSPYCQTECERTCCDLSEFALETDEVGLFALLGEEPSDLSPFEVEGKEGVYIYNAGICPQYDPEIHICKIYDDPNRPQACAGFPFVPLLKNALDDRWVAIRSTCRMVRDSKMMQAVQAFGEGYEVDFWVLNR